MGLSRQFMKLLKTFVIRSEACCLCSDGDPTWQLCALVKTVMYCG